MTLRASAKPPLTVTLPMVRSFGESAGSSTTSMRLSLTISPESNESVANPRAIAVTA